MKIIMILLYGISAAIVLFAVRNEKEEPVASKVLALFPVINTIIAVILIVFIILETPGELLEKNFKNKRIK